MNRLALNLAVLLPAALALAACNDGSVAGRSHGGPITQENSQQVAQALSSTISGALGGVGAGSATQKVRSNATAAHLNFNQSNDSVDCYAVSGDVSDGDSDGIPVDALYTLNDCTYSDGEYSETYGGTEELSDTHPDVADSDYADNFDLTIAWSGPDVTENDHLVGSETGSSGADSFTWVENFSDDYSGTYQGTDFAGNYSEDLTYVFTAASTLTVDGTWSETFNDESVGATLTTTDPLQLSCACESGILSGTVVASSGDSSVTMTWADCVETDTYSGPAS